MLATAAIVEAVTAAIDELDLPKVVVDPVLIATSGEPLLDEMREEAERVLDELVKDHVTEIKLLQEHLHDGLGQLIYDRTGRRPMILPVVVEV